MADKMTDKMISITEEDAKLVTEIQSKTEYPVTIKGVVHKAIADLHKKVFEAQ